MITVETSTPTAVEPVGEIPPSKRNNFNFLRLFFATSVILTHSVELVEGSDRHEILRYFLRFPVSLSYLAVDGFFLLSGYLITQSWLRDPHLFRFLWKRVLRIYPGFAVAILFSALVVGPLGGNPNYWREFDVPAFLTGLSRLSVWTPKAFEGLHYPHVNIPAWTIPYEFLCYLITAALGVLLLLRRRLAIAALWMSVVGYVIWRARIGASYPLHFGFFGHLLWTSPRMVISFLTGALYFLFRDRIRYHWLGVIVCLIGLRLACWKGTTFTIGVPICEGYLVFFCAFVDSSFLKRFRSNADVSYGIYLYAWPIQILIVDHFSRVNPYLLSVLAFVGCYALGTLSWYFVERPCLQWKSASFLLTRFPRVCEVHLGGVAEKRA